MRKIMMFIICLIFMSVSVFAVEEVNVPAPQDFQKVYMNSMGNVTFDHTTHSNLSECSICHIEALTFGEVVSKNVGHKFCKACHKKDEAKVAPTKCKECHVKVK